MAKSGLPTPPLKSTPSNISEWYFNGLYISYTSIYGIRYDASHNSVWFVINWNINIYLLQVACQPSREFHRFSLVTTCIITMCCVYLVWVVDTEWCWTPHSPAIIHIAGKESACKCSNYMAFITRVNITVDRCNIKTMEQWPASQVLLPHSRVKNFIGIWIIA